MNLEKAQNINCVAFILNNHIVNENGSPIEFHDHRFLIAPYCDNSPRITMNKCSQIGGSVFGVTRAIHLARYVGANVIYTLPTRNAVKDFVTPKVDPLIEKNPAFAKMLGATDSTALKKIGDRFVYFRGSWEQSAAISISAQVLISDEVDRSNPKVLRTYRTRLDDARRERPDLGWEWRFSNPSIPGYGVDETWQYSDQKHWFVKCPHCNYEWYMRFPENIDFDRGIYICAKCHRELPDEARRLGRWVKKREAETSGYWINQMMMPWIPATKIIEDSEGDQSVFYNFTLGLPYLSADHKVGRKAIVEAIIPDVNPRTDVAMGVDNGVLKHYVVGNRYGIFKVGVTKSWDEIENIRNQYNAYMVCDMNPYPTPVKRLIEKYPGKVFGHYYEEDKKQAGIIRWGEGDKRGIVVSDRTKIIDAVVADIMSQDIVYNMTLTDLENSEYIYHWEQLYRVVEETARGIRVPRWKTIEGRPDHLAHATVYFRIALEKTLTHGGIIKTQPVKKEKEHPVVSVDNTVPGLDLQEVVKRAKKGKKRDWRLT